MSNGTHFLGSDVSARARDGLEAFLRWGAKKGDRIALVSENRWEWAVTDFAALAIGAADVPIYPTLTGEQIAEQVSDAGCRIAVVSTRQQFDKLQSVRAQTQLQFIVIMDSPAPDGAVAMSELLAGCRRARRSARSRLRRAPSLRRARRSGHAHLHLRNHRRAQGSRAHPRQHRRESELRRRRFRLQFHRRLHLLSATLARHRPRPRLRDVQLRRAGGLLLPIRQAAAGHARDPAHRDRRRSARLRENPPGCGAKGRAIAVKKRLLGWAIRQARPLADTVYDGRRPARSSGSSPTSSSTPRFARHSAAA
jgi:hypothetical protein